MPRVSDSLLRRQAYVFPVLAVLMVPVLLWAWRDDLPMPLLLLLPVVLLTVGVWWGSVLSLHPRKANKWSRVDLTVPMLLLTLGVVRATPPGAEQEMVGAFAALGQVNGAVMGTKARRMLRFRASVAPWRREPRHTAVVVRLE